MGTDDTVPRFALLVAVDDSPEAGVALRAALRKGAALGGTAVHVVHVLPGAPGQHTPAALDRTARELLARVTEAGAALQPSPPAMDVAIHVRTGEPASKVLTVAEEIDAELIVLGPPRGDRLGDVATAVLDEADATVLVSREPLRDRPRRFRPQDPGDSLRRSHRVSFSKPPADTVAPAGAALGALGHAML